MVGHLIRSFQFDKKILRSHKPLSTFTYSAYCFLGKVTYTEIEYRRQPPFCKIHFRQNYLQFSEASCREIVSFFQLNRAFAYVNSNLVDQAFRSDIKSFFLQYKSLKIHLFLSNKKYCRPIPKNLDTALNKTHKVSKVLKNSDHYIEKSCTGLTLPELSIVTSDGFFFSEKRILTTQLFTLSSCCEINTISGSLAESYDNVDSIQKNLTLIFPTSIYITDSKQKNLTLIFPTSICITETKNFIERKDIGQIKPVLTRSFLNFPICIYYFHITYIVDIPHKKRGHGILTFTYPSNNANCIGQFFHYETVTIALARGVHIHHLFQEISIFQLGIKMSKTSDLTEREAAYETATANETATEEELRTATEALDDVHVDDDEESAEVVLMDLEGEEPMKYVSLDLIPSKETKFRLTLIINSPLTELLNIIPLHFIPILTQLSITISRAKSVPKSLAITSRRISHFCASLNFFLIYDNV